MNNPEYLKLDLFISLSSNLNLILRKNPQYINLIRLIFTIFVINLRVIHTKITNNYYLIIINLAKYPKI
jgi:hypothetical protein